MLAVTAVLGLSALVANSAVAQGYRIERIASGLNQPTYVTQAPNDPANILYYTERTENAIPGFGASNNMGRVWRYDVTTRTKTMVLDLSSRSVTNDTGLQTIAFHPDFSTPDTPGYGKLYVSSSQSSSTALNRVEEYTVDLSGPTPSYAASFSRTLLQYQNNAQNNHTIDWIGFDPTATGAERDYLYISTGDGSYGNAYNGGISPTGRPSQNPNDVAGKMLRVDVVGADAYPGDPLKNFAIPSSNPIPTYNAAHPGTPISGFGEVYLTGLRNVYRASFDRANGDLWMGDVGETFAEEVSFLKAGSNDSGPPVDYGWPQREATFDSDVPGAPHTTTNPFTGATSLEPLQQFLHDGGGEAIIGGYLYRGPVPELQGKYFYTDFVGTSSAAQIWSLDFDRDTDPATYNGNNGTSTDISALWQSLVYDPTDPSYMPDSTRGSSAGLDHIVSFGEDNAGNMYLVDFGNGSGFDGQYPGAGLGEIFRIVPSVTIAVTVDRDTGEMIFSNETGVASDIRGYRLSSTSGSLEPDQLTPITNRLDAMPNGDGTIDPDNFWHITSSPGDHEEFSEESTGGATSLSVDEQFTLSPADGWIQSIYEDLQLSVVMSDGTEVPAIIDFVGNGGQAFDRSDLNFNGVIDPGDWPIFREHHLTDLSGMTAAQSYQLGDLDGDGDNDFDDFRLFQHDYVAALGAAAFARLLSVPEPSTLSMLALACGVLLPRRTRRRPTRPVGDRECGLLSIGAHTYSCVSLLSVAAILGVLVAQADADLVHRYSFDEGATGDASNRTIIDSLGGADGTVLGAGATASATQLTLPGGGSGTAAYVDLPNGLISGLTDATFEAWYTIDSAQSWGRIFDFGSTDAPGSNGEVTGPGGGGQGQDYIFYAPSRGADITAQRLGMRNFDPAFGGSDAGTVGGTETTDDPEFDQTLGQQYHVAVVIDTDGGDSPGLGTMTLYIDGALPPGVDQPVETPIQLANLNDVNNWLGRSNWTADSNFSGSLNEFRIYDEALTATDVADSFLSGPDVIPVNAEISLAVNTVTGSVALVNQTAAALNFDYYRVASDTGAIDVAGWKSLDDQNTDAVGAGEGESWDELGQPDAQEVAELYLLGASAAAPDSVLPLGHMFDTSVFGQGQEGDIEFQYARQGTNNLRTGTVMYATPGPTDGDYNNNGVVDAADYTVWRNALGTTLAAADGDGDGLVDEDDYVIWKWNFGNVAAGGASASATAVPEPICASLFAYAMLGPICMSRSFRRQATR